MTKDKIDQVAETINNIKQENLEYYNKYKQNLFEYTKALEQLNNANKIYGREIGNLTTDLNNERIRINELRNEIQDLENAQETFIEIINRLHGEINELKNSKTTLKKDNDYLKDDIETNIDNLYKKFMDKKNDFDARLNRLDDNIKKINDYNKKVDIEELDDFNKKSNDLIFEYDMLREIIYETKDELKKIKNKPNKTKVDLDKIKDLKNKFDLQNAATDFHEQKKESKISEDEDEDDMIKNAESFLKDVKNNKLDRIKVRDKSVSKNITIKFLKKIVKGDINDNNKLNEYSTNLKNILSILNNAPRKSKQIKKYIE